MPLLGPNGQPVPTPEALADAHAALEDGTAEEAPAGPLPCVTAFVVYMLPDGRWQVSDDLDVPLVPDRTAHGDDYTAGCATVMRDVQTQEFGQVMNVVGQGVVQATAQTVLQNLPQVMMQFGGAMRQQAEAAKVAADLEKDKLHRAGRR